MAADNSEEDSTTTATEDTTKPMLEGTHETVDSGSQTEPTTQSPDTPDNAEVDDTPADAEAEQSEELPLDVTFEVLKNKRRRLVLEYLRDTEETVTIGELAEHIAAIENDITVKQLNAQQRKRVYIGLYQCHLPKMDDAGVVNFDQNRGRIEPGDNVEGLYDYLDVGEEVEDTSMEPVYLASSLGFAVLFFAAQATGAATVATGLVVVFLAFVLCLSCWTYFFDEA